MTAERELQTRRCGRRRRCRGRGAARSRRASPRRGEPVRLAGTPRRLARSPHPRRREVAAERPGGRDRRGGQVGGVDHLDGAVALQASERGVAATRTRSPTPSRGSRRRASSTRSRGAVAPSAIRGWRARARVVLRELWWWLDISVRYIESEYTDGEQECNAGGVGTTPGPGAAAPVHSATVRRHTDYALARRAVLRDLQRGRVARLDVCDAHPELIRAARNVGERAPDDCPVCGSAAARARGLRLRRRPPRRQRPLHLARRGAGQARQVARRVHLLPRRGVPRLPVEPPRAPRAPRPPPRPGAAPPFALPANG